MADLSIWYQPLAGGWVKLGTQTSGGRGVLPESIQLEGDRSEGGCLAASFKLKQDPRWINQEMQPFTPIAVWDGAEPIWSGRTIMAPTTFGEDDIEVVVQCQGWWQHLKDDCTDREWVIDDLSRWVDARQMPAINLSLMNLGAQVSRDTGILFSASNGVIFANARTLGHIVLDLGENNSARRVVVEYESSNNAASDLLYVSGTNTGDWPVRQDAVSGHAIGAGTTVAGTLSQSNRYVAIFVYWNGATVTSTADWWVRFTSIKVFTDTADESGNASDLRASTVISETLDEVAPLISTRRDRITTTALSLPQFPGAPGWRYGHELVQQANAPHGYIARLTPDPVPVFEFHPVPTDYRFVLGEGDYQLIEPAAQDGQLVYNRVISEFEDASGVRAHALAYAESNAIRLDAEDNTPIANPTFATNTTGWTITPRPGGGVYGTITRTTATFHSTPASGLLATGEHSSGGYGEVTTPLTGLEPGARYRLGFWYRTTADTWFGQVDLKTAVNDGFTPFETLAQTNLPASTGAFVLREIDFTAPTNGTAYLTVGVFGFSYPTNVLYFDSLSLRRVRSTIPDLRGFRRTALRPMTHRSTYATALAVADIEADSSTFPPFKGTIAVTGRIPLKGGGHMDVSHLPALVGENLVLDNLLDPNTQRLGRIGNIQSVVYNHKSRAALIGIDRDLKFISQLRSRLETAQR